MNLITIRHNQFAPRSERFFAYWGDDFERVDVYGSGPTPESAVRDLIDNYETPPLHEFS